MGFTMALFPNLKRIGKNRHNHQEFYAIQNAGTKINIFAYAALFSHSNLSLTEKGELKMLHIKTFVSVSEVTFWSNHICRKYRGVHPYSIHDNRMLSSLLE
jgi:hypothetical protein